MNTIAASWPIVGVVVSFLSFIWIFRPAQGFEWWHYVIIAVFIVLSVYAAYRDVRRNFRERVFALKDNRKVDEYLRRWIDSDGRVVLFSHDLSWIDHQRENRDVVENKARRRELVLYQPRRTQLSDDLLRLGAEVYTYPELGYVPSSRFTMINVGRVGAQVAIGRGEGSRKIIEEFAVGTAEWHLVEDLVEILRLAAPFLSKPGH